MEIVSGSIFRDMSELFDFTELRVCVTKKGEVYTMSGFQNHSIITWFHGDGIVHVYDMKNELVCPEEESELKNEYKIFDTHSVLSDTNMAFREFLNKLVK